LALRPASRDVGGLFFTAQPPLCCLGATAQDQAKGDDRPDTSRQTLKALRCQIAVQAWLASVGEWLNLSRGYLWFAIKTEKQQRRRVAPEGTAAAQPVIAAFDATHGVAGATHTLVR